MKKTAGLKIKSTVRAGDTKIAGNHNAVKAGVKIRSAVRAGDPQRDKLAGNHNATKIRL